MDIGKKHIRRLEQHVIEKIAAGEVIERPASVLKELVENSIDACATKIVVAIENAGFSLISVSDNGTGISAADLPLSVERHATSKISSIADLYSLTTMGFRGEALASISAVSRTTISSCTDDTCLGNMLVVEGGIVSEVIPCNRTKGTTVTCRDLFFNVPARRKFMKSQRAEQLALLHCMEQLVIPYPGIHFTMTVDGRVVLDTPVVNTVLMRIAQVIGDETARELIKCSGTDEGYGLTLYISPTSMVQSRPRFQNVYINLRRADCDTITFSIREAYARFINSKLRPSYYCFLDIDPAKVDVNVHPTKQRVKFEDERKIFGFIYHIVEQTLAHSTAKDKDFMPGDSDSLQVVVEERQKNISVVQEQMNYENSAQEELIRENIYLKNSQSTFQSDSFTTDNDKFTQKHIDLSSSINLQLSENERQERWKLISCFQVHEMYILAPIKNGILLIDQHAAHERVLFEQALKNLTNIRAESQHLLFPVIIELTITEKTIILAANDYFSSFGFAISDFGGQAIAVSAIPAFMKVSEVETAIACIAGYLMDEKTTRYYSEPEKRCAAAFACGAAIKAGQKLSPEEMNALLNSLFATENPYTCPHGRPTVVRISLSELQRRFLR